MERMWKMIKHPGTDLVSLSKSLFLHPENWEQKLDKHFLLFPTAFPTGCKPALMCNVHAILQFWTLSIGHVYCKAVKLMYLNSDLEVNWERR